MTETLSTHIRKEFPSLANTVNGYPVAFLDGPGGYQVPQTVIQAVDDYLINSNANVEGMFETSRKTDQMLKEARCAFADFFNCSSDEVIFGANMTTLNFSLAQALMREMTVGDKVIITEIDHEGNRGPWEQLRERGVIVEEAVVDTETCTLSMADLERKLSAGTRVVAVNYASNAVGTITDVKKVVKMAHSVGAFTIVDAVHYAAHRSIDVREIGTDFLFCSAYKFFGPHIGVMYAKKEVLSKLRPMRVRPQKSYPPDMFETGTLHHEGIAGAAAAVGFVADMGAKFGKQLNKTPESRGDTRRNRIVAGLIVFDEYEAELTQYLIKGLEKINKIKIYGPPTGHPRTSTVSFTYDGFTPYEVADYLGERGLSVWHGDFFAARLVERLGLRDQGGLIRVGIAPYNTREELTRLIDSLNDTAALKTFVSTKR